jgi:hypothetical protein
MISDSQFCGSRSKDNESQTLTQAEAALLLGVEPRTMEAWRARKCGPRFLSYSRRCVRYRREDLLKFMDRHAVSTGAAAE